MTATIISKILGLGRLGHSIDFEITKENAFKVAFNCELYIPEECRIISSEEPEKYIQVPLFFEMNIYS